ncbi:hypothetical protein ACFLXY_07470 [Chloroflexota bacterium]
MDSYFADNQSETLSTLLEGFNELIRKAYIQGFKDGQEFELKISGKEANNLDNEVSDYISGLNPDKARIFKETEQILQEYS